MPARTYSLNNTSTNALATRLFGSNYNVVDLKENAVVTVGGGVLDAPSTNSTYSISSATSTLYTIGSDEIGNITNVCNVTVDWNGRRLESISQSGTELVSYEYNMDGQRTKKIVTDPTTGTTTTTEYFYNGSILAGQKTGNDEIVFMYDNNGDVFGFTYNGTPYYYVKNAQNDVYFIIDENGYAQVLYQYDAWGNVTFCIDATDFGLAAINPIMYRSYYVDLEMGMFIYYLNSRYYIAEWGRFASADAYVQTGQGMLDKNMFAYCENNPVVRIDNNGSSWSVILVQVGIGVATQYVGDIVGNLADGETGINVLIPTSSLGEYVAAGVTALIPGSGWAGSLTRNIVTEGIKAFEIVVSGGKLDVVDSLENLLYGSILDYGFGKISDKVVELINFNIPQNYSSYAHKKRISNPNISQEEIYLSMQRSIRFRKTVSKAFSVAIDAFETILS